MKGIYNIYKGTRSNERSIIYLTNSETSKSDNKR